MSSDDHIFLHFRLIEKRERNPELWYRNQYDPGNFPNEDAHNINMYADGVHAVAAFVGSKPQDLVLVENATTGKGPYSSFFLLKTVDTVGNCQRQSSHLCISTYA